MPTVTTSPFLVCVGVTMLSAGVSFGFSLSAVRSAQGPARTLALYALVRSLALFAASFASFFVDWAGWLKAIAATMVVVQAGDALVGFTIKDRMKTIGPAVTAAANALALFWFFA